MAAVKACAGCGEPFPLAALIPTMHSKGRFCPKCYERRYVRQRACLWCLQQRPASQFRMRDGSRSYICATCAASPPDDVGGP